MVAEGHAHYGLVMVLHDIGGLVDDQIPENPGAFAVPLCVGGLGLLELQRELVLRPADLGLGSED